MPIYAIGDVEPRIDPSAYIHPEAVIIGNVIIGPEASVWPHAVIRADDSFISVGARSSVQDNVVLHCTPDLPTVVGEDVTLGHLCHLEGCTIEDRSLIGVGSVVIHEVVIGRGSIVGANAMVRNGTIVPPRS
ncbi:MAG: gamma carbonic anhydrase family protein, partial [Actinobacteria bacterium]|nr:gamma carbonic anhydrase family protein [Actinomycetota bacterium]